MITKLLTAMWALMSITFIIMKAVGILKWDWWFAIAPMLMLILFFVAIIVYPSVVTWRIKRKDKPNEEGKVIPFRGVKPMFEDISEHLN